MADRGRLPDFVVIGTMKSGTTTLYRWLEQHPDIAFPEVKEPNFFSHERCWRRGRDWYEKLFAGVGSRQRTGEASVAYTDPRWARRAAERLWTTAPEARLICLLRHPIDRLRSHYRHEVQRRRERRALPTALDEPGNRYLACSRYTECLQPWIETFPRRQLCIVRFEDLVGDDGATWRRLLDHVGVSERDRPDGAFNVTVQKPQFTAPMRMLWASGAARRLSALPGPVRRAGRRLLLRGGERYRTELNRSEAVIPVDVVAAVWSDVARLPRLAGDERLTW